MKNIVSYLFHKKSKKNYNFTFQFISIIFSVSIAFASSNGLVQSNVCSTQTSPTQKLDLLLVIDDSYAQVSEANTLALRLYSLVTGLTNLKIDWQMCLTSPSEYYSVGQPSKWQGTNVRALAKNTLSSANLLATLKNTINSKISLNKAHPQQTQELNSSIISIINDSKYSCFRQGADLHLMALPNIGDINAIGDLTNLSSEQYQAILPQVPPAQTIETLNKKIVSSNCMNQGATISNTNSMVVCDSNNTIVTQYFKNKDLQNSTCSSYFINHQTVQKIEPTNNQVDILLVIDDSFNMTQNDGLLTAKLNGFISNLQKSTLDWQMCLTTTDVDYFDGRPIPWIGSDTTNVRYITKKTPNLATVIRDTILANDTNGSNDERGIMASIKSLLNNYNIRYQCYRPKAAALSVILISNEDERSVGGNLSLSHDQAEPLELNDLPTSYIKNFNKIFNVTTNSVSKKIAFNSIVVTNEACQKIQDLMGSPSFIGTQYMELSNLTEGTVQNICNSSYSNINIFNKELSPTSSTIVLDCAPVGRPLAVIPSQLTYKVTDNKIIFTPALKAGTTISLDYQCKQ